MNMKAITLSLTCISVVACAQRTASVEEEPTIESTCVDWCAG